MEDALPESTTLTLGPEESAPGKPFTSVELLTRDVSHLRGMLDDLIDYIRRAAGEHREIEHHERDAWVRDGLARRLLICDETRLRTHEAACVVGFFGERRTDLDIGPLEQANTAIVAQFKDYPGILSYSSVELPNGYWANMVLHDDPVDREYWSRGALHAQAAKTLSPIHYRSVRIHNARLTNRIESNPSFEILKTKFWDYTGKEVWAAEREFIPSDPAGIH